VNKKKAADDAKLLANRIALLKMEEKKAWKKIQETKRKAEQVMQSDSETRRTAPGETTSGECGSKRRRSGYIKMLMPKNKIEKQS